MPTERTHPYLGIIFITLVAAIDQVSKIWLVFGDAVGGGWLTTMPRPILPFIDFILVWNRGISYGLLARDSTTMQSVLIAISFGIIGLLIWQMWRETHRPTLIAYAMIVGGAIGNVIDRIIYGAVIDFIAPHAFEYHWYVFNFADIAITVGIGLLLVSFFKASPINTKRQ